jgi:hypothetical protein
MSGKNPFAALQMDSDSEVEEQEEKKVVEPSPSLRIMTPTSSPSLRVWKLEEGEERPKNVFKSPFSQKKRKQKEHEKEGWVSIQKNQPQFVDDNASTESEREIKKEVFMEALTLEPVSPPEFKEEVAPTGTQDFPSLIGRGTGLTAMDWAERVRTSLERAEQARNKPPSAAQKTEEFANSLGRLSFFRRPVTSDE